jgi:NADPH:quinone reductase
VEALDLLHASAAPQGETVLLHGAAGAVGVSVLQQARQLGVRVRVVTIVAARAKADGYIFVGVSNPGSGPFRARERSRILKLAEDGYLVVPMAQTFGFADAPAALAGLTSPHPPGKLALINEG